MTDRVKLSDLKEDPLADQVVKELILKDELDEKERQLKRNIAALQAEIAGAKQSQASPSPRASNKIGARKAGTFKAVSTAPSINKTPIGPSMVPIPYPVVQDLTNSANTARTVNFNGCPVYVLDGSVQPRCTGDEAGTGKGVKSGTVSGEVKPVTGSCSVRVEGKKVVRDGDACTMNGGNSPGVYVNTSPSIGKPSAAPLASSPASAPKTLREDVSSVDAGFLRGLKPQGELETLLSEIRENTLKWKFPGIPVSPTPLELRQIESLRSKYFGQSLVPWDGDSRSAAEKFIDRNHVMYESSVGGAFYGVIRAAGGDDRLGRAFGIFGSGLELSGGLGLGALKNLGGQGGGARSSGNGVKISTRSFFKWTINKETLSQAAQKRAKLYESWKNDVGRNYRGIEEQVDAFKDLIKNESPWPDRFVPNSVILPIGTKIYMAIAPTQLPTTPGGFGTLTPIADKASVRNDLAVKLRWKPEIGSAVEYEVTKPLPVRQGPVGPQIDLYSGIYLPGKSDQVNFDIPKGDSRMNYVKVVDVKPLN